MRSNDRSCSALLLLHQNSYFSPDQEFIDSARQPPFPGLKWLVYSLPTRERRDNASSLPVVRRILDKFSCVGRILSDCKPFLALFHSSLLFMAKT
ncbi:hypothetical protein HPP92_009742 [Vanilla planifolia]|uniref:Uncharacterized protein n=1 Tax=Vanilla planifolia TaxID=51239 RepID=A0A835RKH8_VANPL|nr:hypothetical protein HPP92_009742 [Vanilla planifolia]